MYRAPSMSSTVTPRPRTKTTVFAVSTDGARMDQMLLIGPDDAAAVIDIPSSCRSACRRFRSVGVGECEHGVARRGVTHEATDVGGWIASLLRVRGPGAFGLV